MTHHFDTLRLLAAASFLVLAIVIRAVRAGMEFACNC